MNSLLLICTSIALFMAALVIFAAVLSSQITDQIDEIIEREQ